MKISFNFQNSKTMKIASALHFSCCIAVELGCEHWEDDICLYCDYCLKDLIKDNNGNCAIIIIPSRATRKKICKSIINCPYSLKYKQKQENNNNNNNGGQLIDTVGLDEKESIIPFVLNNKGCWWWWSGKLWELINSNHLQNCTKKI